jgi:hypothetical protein
MAAGLGFKDFATGEVLTAADVDGYLMQGVWVFASAAARDAAVTSPQEGNFAYLKDTNVTTYYTGSAWANLDTTGMTNPMTTTADMIYSSSGSTPARLGIGTAGQVLTVNSGATAPEWAAPAAGGLTLLSTTSLTSTSTEISISASSYINLRIIVRDIYMSGANESVWVRLNADTASNYSYAATELIGSTNSAASSIGDTKLRFSPNNTSNNTLNQKTQAEIFIPRCNDTDLVQFYASVSGYTGASANGGFIAGRYDNSAAITSITFASLSAATFSGGTVYVYGEK